MKIPASLERYRLSDMRFPSLIAKVWEWRHSMMMGYPMNGKMYLTTFRELACSAIMNTEWQWIYLRQDSCTILTSQDMTETPCLRQEMSFLSSQDCLTACSPGMNGERQWDTVATNPVIQWLESPDGERWSRSKHTPVGLLVTTKDDLEYDDDLLIVWHR